MNEYVVGKTLFGDRAHLRKAGTSDITLCNRRMYRDYSDSVKFWLAMFVNDTCKRCVAEYRKLEACDAT